MNFQMYQQIFWIGVLFALFLSMVLPLIYVCADDLRERTFVIVASLFGSLVSGLIVSKGSGVVFCLWLLALAVALLLCFVLHYYCNTKPSTGEVWDGQRPGF